jgi:hypothetical protein
VFPDRIRFIITVDHRSNSHKYLTGIGSEVIHMTVEKSLYWEMIQSMKSRPTFCDAEYHARCYAAIEGEYENDEIDNTLYIKSFCSSFVPYETKSILSGDEIDADLRLRIMEILCDIDLDRFDDIAGIDDLMQYILEYFERRIMDREKFIKVLALLIQTFKGLTYDELDRVVKFEKNEWILMRLFFKSFFFVFRGYWKISNDIFVKAVESRYMKDAAYMHQISRETAAALEKTPTSIRKLEEICGHFYKSKDYLALKQTVSQIDNFLLLFNQNTKYDLYRYWLTLGEKNDYDPVVEYNKGLELFDMHYTPTVEDLFTIIIQVSRFLKEFTDFESRRTPEFRHPFIKGKTIQLKEGQTKADHNMGDQTGSLFDLFKKKLAKKGANWDDENTSCLAPFKDDDCEVSDLDVGGADDDEDANKVNYLKDIGLLNELIKMKMTEGSSNPVISGHEHYNVDVPNGRVKFMEHFKEIIWQKKVKKNHNVDPDSNMPPDFDIDQGE